MNELLEQLIRLLERINGQERAQDEVVLISQQLTAMEHRYHTWMNYYSLFNGALLVAYCTLLVSTGRIIKQHLPNETVYNLECSYWGFLALIALLGVIASYCWLLSMIGHNHWLNNWRRKLQKRYPAIMRDISGDSSLDSQLCTTLCGKRVLPGFYSTFEVTKVFIWSVITAWIMIFIHALSQYVDCHLSIAYIITVGIFILLILYWLRHILHYLLGSRLNGFTINGILLLKGQQKCFAKALSNFLCASGCHKVKGMVLVFGSIIIILLLCQASCINGFWTKLCESLFECCCCCCQ